VIVNRVLPDDVRDPWFDRWRATHAEHLDAVRADFSPVPVVESRLAPSDVVGVDALRGVGEELWSGRDPAARLVNRRPVRLSRRGDDVELTVDLPFADRSEVEVSRSGDELLITLGAQRRALALPESLRRREVRSAAVADGALRVCFTGRARIGT
jgi:arsenite-transporting ATPase